TAADRITTLNLIGISTVIPFGGAVQNLTLHANTATPPTYSTATIFSTGNVTNSISEDAGNALTLGADLTLAGNLNLRGALYANGHAVSAATINVGSVGGPVTFQDQ